MNSLQRHVLQADSSDVIQGDEQCRDGHYRAKQNLRTQRITSTGRGPASELDPSDSTSVQAQNPTDMGSSGLDGPLKRLPAFLPSGIRWYTALVKRVRFDQPKLL